MEFVCSAIGSPAPSIYWLDSSGNVLETHLSDGSGLEGNGDLKVSILPLQLSDIMKGDEGFYTCHAENDFGVGNLTLQLTVQGKHAQRLLSANFLVGYLACLL